MCCKAFHKRVPTARRPPVRVLLHMRPYRTIGQVSMFRPNRFQASATEQHPGPFTVASATEENCMRLRPRPIVESLELRQLLSAAVGESALTHSAGVTAAEIPTRTFNVKDYGAKGNGVAD